MKLDPKQINARLGLARVAMTRGELETALSWLKQAESVAPDEGAVHVHLAQVYHEMGRHADAVRAERRTAATPHPALPDGLAALDDPVREEVKRRESVSSTRLLREAQRYLLEGREDQAMQALEKALEADAESVMALIWSARLLMKRGELDPARARLEQALENDPANAQAQIELGAVHALTGRFEPAILALRKALEIDPARFGIKTKLAGLLFQSGRSPEALVLLREASRDLPGDLDVQHRLAAVLMSMDRLDEAVPILTGLVEADAVRTETRIELGHALWQLRRHDEAIRVFRQGVAVAPDDPQLSHRLAWSLATCPRDELRDGQTALILARSLCEATEYGNPEFLDGLAAAQAETGDFSGAAESTKTALQIVERTYEARATGLNAASQGQFEQVLKQLRGRLALYERGVPYRDTGEVR